MLPPLLVVFRPYGERLTRLGYANQSLCSDRLFFLTRRRPNFLHHKASRLVGSGCLPLLVLSGKGR